MTIKKKIGLFTGAVFLIISLAVLFDFWVVRFSLTDFSRILEENVKSGAFVNAMEEESALFDDYIKDPSEEKRLALEAACKKTQKAIDELPFEYHSMDEYRYSKTWSIHNSYPVYSEQREEVLRYRESNTEYIGRLYAVYDMQQYLQNYARTLMRYTLDAGSATYQHKVPTVKRILILVIIFGITMLVCMLKVTDILRKTIISPIMKLVQFSKRIAKNDYYIDDLEVESQDELGELVRAFNKMKYSTGAHILALEEKRRAMDRLHEEELERLDLERRLETTRLQVLQNQINPHFLFNALNVIRGMAKLEDAETTEKMIEALSTLFRYNLKTTEAEVQLIKELHVVREYMYLQKMRFGSRISYEIKCEVDKMKVKIPSFTLQPLVENSIAHGLSQKEDGGRIVVHIWQREKLLYISIADTGDGMTEEKLADIRRQIAEGKDGPMGIGLGNVCKRTKGMYPDSEVSVFSALGKGTVVRIIIPQK